MNNKLNSKNIDFTDLARVNVLNEKPECFRLHMRHADGCWLSTNRWRHSAPRNSTNFSAFRVLKTFTPVFDKYNIKVSIKANLLKSLS